MLIPPRSAMLPRHSRCEKISRHHDGFTLVELLVVISIIALLIGILLPALSSAREASRRAVCLSNIRQISITAVLYASDAKGALPKQSGSSNTATNLDSLMLKGMLNSGSAGPTRNSGWYMLNAHGPDPANNHKLYLCPSDQQMAMPPYWHTAYRKMREGNELPAPSNSATNAAISYGYRFNNGSQSQSHSLAPYDTTEMIQNAFDQELFIGRALFHDRWTGTAATDGTPLPVWNHRVGGNVARFDGSAVFVANQIIDTSATNIRYNWPTTESAGRADYDTNGETADVPGVTRGLDIYLKNRS